MAKRRTQKMIEDIFEGTARKLGAHHRLGNDCHYRTHYILRGMLYPPRLGIYLLKLPLRQTQKMIEDIFEGTASANECTGFIHAEFIRVFARKHFDGYIFGKNFRTVGSTAIVCGGAVLTVYLVKRKRNK